MELRDRDLDRDAEVEFALPLLKRGDDAVLQATKADVCFREEVAASASGVEERERGNLILQGEERFFFFNTEAQRLREIISLCLRVSVPLC